MNIELARQEIQKQKELPTLSPNIQRILAACEDHDISQGALANVLGESPTIAARLLGLANSSFFGQQGRIHSLSHAISVLGMVTVRSVAIGLALSGVFKTDRCPHFRLDRYWLSAVVTALMASRLNPSIMASIRPPNDSVYMAGLLHNIGLLALAYLHPEEMDAALSSYASDPSRKLADHIRETLEIDHYQAGVWLGSKWHLPRDILLVMEHHYDRSYRGDHWPLVLLEGICARWANQIIDETPDMDAEHESIAALGLTDATATALWLHIREKLDGIREVSAMFLTA